MVVAVRVDHCKIGACQITAQFLTADVTLVVLLVLLGVIGAEILIVVFQLQIGQPIISGGGVFRKCDGRLIIAALRRLAGKAVNVEVIHSIRKF
ncbi:hypothetical protein D4A47_13510 [Anaerotruncus massiliensis (ex Liu et al. 2021)]|uniref:Uncharacterized protein n=1 Tax=Anaerotruncus massiliensis (ex Liu et al. 2021) TaxID=2321404 RepID=A0A498CIT2_9FIRM|nr:hypothetical protein D4A47_13510 [Anaerotruncus massiliensis (ex Liu et al. 2021)]